MLLAWWLEAKLKRNPPRVEWIPVWPLATKAESTNLSPWSSGAEAHAVQTLRADEKSATSRSAWSAAGLPPLLTAGEASDLQQSTSRSTLVFGYGFG
jgi:hypothetical protein